MDELQGDQGVWRFDGQTVAVRYHTRRATPALLRALGECRVPMDAVRAVEFRRGDRKAGWRLRLRLVEGADPYSAVTAFPDDGSDPFALTGPADSELIAEYFSEQLGLAVPDEGEADAGPRVDSAEVARGLVPSLPLRIRTAEGSASFDGRTVRLRWDGVLAGSAKGHERTRDFPIEDIAKVEWEPQVGLEVGFLRLVPRGEPVEHSADPEEDPTCLCSHGGKGQAHTFMMAAAITAHVRPEEAEPPAITAAGPADDSQLVYDRIRELGRLHEEGLLTDDEFSTKKAELLRRL